LRPRLLMRRRMTRLPRVQPKRNIYVPVFCMDRQTQVLFLLFGARHRQFKLKNKDYST